MAAPPRKPLRDFSLPQLLPNFLTVGAICAGLTAMRFAFHGRYDLAVGLIVLAAVLDGMDGRLARLLKSESEIGAELDSLADFVNFGVAPGMVMYLWALQSERQAGWIAVLIYAICCVLRLARFNVGNRASAGKETSRFFTGVPSPAGGLLAMLPLYLDRLVPVFSHPPALLVGAWMVIVGFLMIGRFPTPSVKLARIQADNVKFVVVAFVTLLAALLTYPWATLVAMSVAYLASILWAVRGIRRPSAAGED